MTTATRPAGPTTRYEHIGAVTPGRAPRRRFYIWDAEDLHDGPYDIVAMERAINGEYPHATLNEAEQYETARRLHALTQRGYNIPGGNIEIARRVGVDERTIVRWNKNGWPKREANPDGTLRPIARLRAIEERWASNTRATEDGHRLWTGGLCSGSRQPAFTYQRRLYQAARVAWRIKHGTDPEGSARPGCGIDLCVEPDHIADINIAAAKKRGVVAS